MRKFLPDLPVAFALVAACAATACMPASFLGGGMRNHPSALVGEWVDSIKSTPADTSLWLLGASGNDASQHVRIEPDSAQRAPAAPAFVTTRERHYGYWYFQGALDDRANRAICFTNRPGRSAASCLSFDLDTVSTTTGVRRRLVVRGYQGNHTTADRVLLARRP